MKYPITAIVGIRGVAKTLLMAALAESYQAEGHFIVANFHLKRIPYKYATFKEIATLPPWLENAVVFLDEIQAGADAYDFMNKRVRKITTLATQLRKRKITLFYSTQIFLQTVKRLRMQTNYIFELHKTNVVGIPHIKMFDRELPLGQQLYKEWVPDLRPWFPAYDTDEVITAGDEDDLKDVTVISDDDLLD